MLETGRPNESLRHLQIAVGLDPNNPDAHYNLGNTLLQMARTSEAVAEYKRALELYPDDTQTMNNLAWTLATWPEALLRDGAKAVELAERADTLTQKASPIVSATLAAAYAEAARFEDAQNAARRAIDLALKEGNESRADSIRSQLHFYESGAAYRDRRFR